VTNNFQTYLRHGREPTRTNNYEAESFAHWSFDNNRWLRNDYCRRKLSIAS